MNCKVLNICVSICCVHMNINYYIQFYFQNRLDHLKVNKFTVVVILVVSLINTIAVALITSLGVSTKMHCCYFARNTLFLR